MPIRVITKEEFAESIRAESFEKGVAMGRAELSEEIARKMKKENADYNFISRVTSLPVERIAQL